MKYKLYKLFLIAGLLLTGSSVFANTDVIKTCYNPDNTHCYFLVGLGAIGGSGDTSGAYDGSYTGIYPSYDTGLSNSWQNSNTHFNPTSYATQLGFPSSFWLRFANAGGAGTDWIYQFYYNGTDYTQTLTSGIIINTPNNGITLMDFQNWNITWAGLGTNLKQLGIHYSTDATLLADCEEFPYGATAGYSDCINVSPRIYTDYGIATTIANGTANITKNTTLVLGTTYYAQAVVQVTNSFGSNIAVSPIISFTIGIPPTDETDAGSCGSFDLICYIKAGAIWLFGISNESLERFDNLTLENSFPFSYLYDMGNLYDDAFNQSADDFSIEIPFGSGTLVLLSTDALEAISFQSLVRTIMGAICIFMTAMLLYRKVIKIHDANHKTV